MTDQERQLMMTYTADRRVDFTPDPDLFPFESRWFDSSVGPIHYIDEGEGRPLLLMHGNPDWSFLYRKMIPLLTDKFRCIAIDYPGFGLSVHPENYGYLPSEHAKVVAELVEHLDIQDAILVGQDWGGPIGMDVASRSPERFTGLVMGNTFYFPSTFKMQRTFSKLMATGFMQKRLLEKGMFVNTFMRMLVQDDMTQAEWAHYKDVAPDAETRKGHAVFPVAIVGETEWLAEVEKRVAATLSDRPMLFIVGMKDTPMTTKSFLGAWEKRWPKAKWVKLPKASHYWQEDEPETAAQAIIDMYG